MKRGALIYISTIFAALLTFATGWVKAQSSNVPSELDPGVAVSK